MVEEVNCRACESNKNKSDWGLGPWQNEPDRVEFQHAGHDCIIHRNEVGGVWCGYVAVKPDHPYYELDYNDVYNKQTELGIPEENMMGPHGGLTYAAECHGHICHVPLPGDPDNVWWFGFDMGHGWDLMPALEARMNKFSSRPIDALERAYGERVQYRDMNYAINQTKELAEALNYAASRQSKRELKV